MNPEMMNQILKKRGLMRKASNSQNTENNNNSSIKNDSKIKNANNNNNLKMSFKDRVHTFEISDKEKEKNIDNCKNKGKGPPKTDINNNNNVNKKISKNIIISQKASDTQSKSFENYKNNEEHNDLILHPESKKTFKSIKVLSKSKLNLENFPSQNINININNNKPKEKEDIEETMKINEILPITRNSTPLLNNTKEKEKKRYSLIDENNNLTIKLKSKNKYKKEDFEILNFLGKGAYGTVLQVSLLSDPKKKIYAIKKLDIISLLSVNRLYQAYLENDILSQINCPYIVKVHGAFEADEKIHLVMDYMPKGDFSYFIKANYPLRPDVIKFYTAEMVLFLEYMQKMKLIHRDLKPQNIMIDEKGHLKVIDFGTVRKIGFYYDKKEMKFKEEKMNEIIDSEDIKGVKNVVNPDEQDVDEDSEEEEEKDDEENIIKNNNDNKDENNKLKMRSQRSMTFVGTAEYISPEVIADKPSEFGTDIWAFGVMIYQMIFNTTPFKAQTAYLTFRKIESAEIDFPKNSNDISEEAKELLKKIFVKDPKKRIGGGDPGSEYDIAHLKKLKFFKNINWNRLHITTPPFFNQMKYYESKRKSIYKQKGNNNKKQETDSYIVFDDKSESNDIKIIKEGYIKKKSSWFHYEKRYVVLDTTPRLIITHMNGKENKKLILRLTRKCKVSIVDNNCFDLKTPEKNHRFKGLANDGNDWAGLINDVILDYAKE